MLTTNELRADRTHLNKIDWGITLEKADEIFLEWGTGGIGGNDFLKYEFRAMKP